MSEGARAREGAAASGGVPEPERKHWFDEELFLGLMRVRGVEAASASGYAEAFTCRKLSLRSMSFGETAVAGVVGRRARALRGRARVLRADLGREEFAERGLEPGSRPVQHLVQPPPRHARGLHYQVAPHEEAKLVRCTAGAIFDVAVDLRPDSPTFRRGSASSSAPRTGSRSTSPRAARTAS